MAHANRHRIRRQTLELAIPSADLAPSLQDRLGSIHQRRLLPIIDRCLSEASPSNRVLRIDRLVVDLGTIDPEHLEEVLVERLGAHLPRALASRLQQVEVRVTDQESPAGRQSEDGSDLSMLDHFARSGRLPWWADAADRNTVGEAVQRLLAGPTAAPAGWLRRLPKPAVQRLLLHLGDEPMAKLYATLRGTAAAASATGLSSPELELLLRLSPTLTSPSRKRIRTAIWQAAFEAGRRHTPMDSRSLRLDLLSRLAADLHLPLPELTEALGQILDRPSALNTAESVAESALGRLITELRTPEPAVRPLPEIPSMPDDPAKGRLDALRNLARSEDRATDPRSEGRLAEERPSEAGLADSRALQGADLPATASAPWPAVASSGQLDADPPVEFATASDKPAGEGPKSQNRSAQNPATASVPSSAEAEEAAASARQHRPPQGSQRSQGSQRASESALRSSGSEAEARAAGSLSTRGASDPSAGFSADNYTEDDTDKAYVDNAGLVLLWPFLGRFFERAKLMTDREFHDEHARQRAVGLLQWLVDGEPSPVEFQITLNKVLCGMALERAFDFEPTITDRDAELGSELLSAVIDNAPVLGKMSQDGFRGSFLLRKGVLSVEGPSWLLQVEGETYDVVLDRFPWPREWVRLPWMQGPLRVEWP